MFDLSWGEMMLIGAVALIVIGPKDLPRTLRAVGQGVGKVKRMASEFQGQFNQAMREAELDQVRKDVEGMSRAAQAGLNPAKAARDEIKRAVEGKASPAKDGPGKGASGKGASGKGASGKTASGKEAPGKVGLGKAEATSDPATSGASAPSLAKTFTPEASPARTPALASAGDDPGAVAAGGAPAPAMPVPATPVSPSPVLETGEPREAKP